MVTKYENKQLKINMPLRGYQNGSIVRVKADKDGILVDSYWRNRLKDAEIDNCCEVVVENKITKKKKGGK